METLKATKPRRPRRTKADIETAIEKAAISQIKKKGFAGALVTDIVKRAKIEPIVFYNRYKNLYEFYDDFVKRYDYWLNDLIRSLKHSKNKEQEYVLTLETLFKALAADEIMTELLRWEIAEDSHITERTARLRELDFTRLLGRFDDALKTDDLDVSTLTTLLVGGIYYMVLHKKIATFGGIDIDTTEGERRINTALEQFASLIYSLKNKDEKRKRLAECLRKEGLSPEAIERCLAEMDK